MRPARTLNGILTEAFPMAEQLTGKRMTVTSKTDYRSATTLTESEYSRIIEMAWEDRTPFEAIKSQFGLDETQVIILMRSRLKRSSFKLWRTRVTGRVTKHQMRRPSEMNDGQRHTATLRQPTQRR